VHRRHAFFPHSFVFDAAIGTSISGLSFSPLVGWSSTKKEDVLTEALYREASCPIDNISTIHPRAERCRFLASSSSIATSPLSRNLVSSLFLVFPHVPHISPRFIFRRKENRQPVAAVHSRLPLFRRGSPHVSKVHNKLNIISNDVSESTPKRERERKRGGEEAREQKKKSESVPRACAMRVERVPSRRASRRRSLDSLDDAASST